MVNGRDELAIGLPAPAGHAAVEWRVSDDLVPYNAALAAMEARLAALKKLGVDTGSISFAARFGRNMEYYTGFVFELWSKDEEGPVQVAGGGRYDTLLEHLGAKRSIPAIGFSIRTERVLASRQAQSKTKGKRKA